MLSFTLFVYAALINSVLTLPASSPQILLPRPGGKYAVGRGVTELIDSSRTQPFAPDVEPRKLMISVFYPVDGQHLSTTGAYFPPETARIEDLTLSGYGLAAPNGTFEKVGLHLAGKPIRTKRQQAFPIALFMPAEGTTRLFYNQIASSIASTGYTVVTMDAPYDVDVVEYQDGSIATYNETLWNDPNQETPLETAYVAIQTRVEDVSFVLNSLSNATIAHSLVPNLPESGLNTTHTAMFGHSFGGATAFSILEADSRVLGGLNMDGGLYGPGLHNGTNKPFMLMGHANHTRERKQLWPNLRGWRKDTTVADTLHYDFSDYAVVFETLGIMPTNETVLEGPLLLGTLKGTRALQIVTSYAGAFLDFVIHGRCSALLDGPVKEFPEVAFEY